MKSTQHLADRLRIINSAAPEREYDVIVPDLTLRRVFASSVQQKVETVDKPFQEVVRGAAAPLTLFFLIHGILGRDAELFHP